ncbi:MAG: hypothetical protein IPI38_16690 [Gemmatimonadetes bacterium]|nr:hypothetical protein [Gemmatimonadota bacterium]MBK7717030.1 hypothetical protein [Gemmatimonadota bacterium]
MTSMVRCWSGSARWATFWRRNSGWKRCARPDTAWGIGRAGSRRRGGGRCGGDNPAAAQALELNARIFAALAALD